MTSGRARGATVVWVAALCSACAPSASETTKPADTEPNEAVQTDKEAGLADAIKTRLETWQAAPVAQRDVAELEAMAAAALGLAECEGECLSVVLRVGTALEEQATRLRDDEPERATALLESKLRIEMRTASHELAIRTAGDLIDVRGDLALVRKALEDVLAWEAGLEYDEKTSARFDREQFEKGRRHYRAMAEANMASLAIAESRFEDAITRLDAAEAAGHRSLRSHQERARAVSALAGGVPDASTRQAAADACFADFVDQPACLRLFDTKVAEPAPDRARRKAAIEAARSRVLEEESPTEDSTKTTRPAQAYAQQHALDERPTVVAVASKYCKPCKEDPEELAEAAKACPDARLLLMWETDDGEAPKSTAKNLEIVAVNEEASQPATGYPHHAVFSEGELVFAGSGASLDGWWRFMFELEAAGAKCKVPAFPKPSGRTGWGSHASQG